MIIGREINLTDIDIIDEDLSLLYIIKARKELDDRGFPGSVFPD